MGTWRRGQFPQHIPTRTAWPLLHPSESDAADFAILNSPSFEVFSQQNSSITHSKFIELENKFITSYNQIIDGSNFNSNYWKEWTNQMSLSYDFIHEETKRLQAEKLIPLNYLSDLCEDYSPEIGMFCNSFIWGSLAQSSIPTSMRILSGAICAMLPILSHKLSPASKAFEQRPKLPLEVHYSLAAHSRYPFMLWDLRQKQITPLLPMAQQYTPPSTIQNLPTTPFMLGKVLMVNNEWTAHFVLPVKDIGDLPTILRQRFLLEWIRAQRHNPKIFFEDILRERADILYRYTTEYLIETKSMEIQQCLDYYLSLAPPQK
jgi:hypothetical protein